jgi:multiple sugar transport system substrate-binding protein
MIQAKRHIFSQQMKLSLFLVFVFASLVLAGCSKQRTSEESGSDKIVQLTYWPAPNPQEMQLADTLVREWNQLHPNIHVNMQPIPVSQSTEEVLLAAIAGKTTPDVCSNIQPAALYDYSRAGGIIPLDQFSDFDSVALSRTPKDLLDQFRSGDGHFYQIPWKTNPVMMFYNVRMFEEVGIKEPPRTYSEFFADAKKLTRDLNGDGQIDVWMGERDIRPIWWQRLFDFFPFYIGASSGKTLFNDGVPDFNDQSAVEVFKFFQECYQKNYFPHTYFQGGDPFLLEKKATHFAGPWEIATLRSLAPQVRYDVAQLPVPDNHTGPVYTYGDYKNISIFGTSKHPREAWEFVKFLVQPRNDLMLLRITDQIPIRGDLLTNPLFAGYFKRNPKMVKFAEQAMYTRSIDSGPDMKEILDAISQEYEACAVYGKITPSQAVSDAMKRTIMIVDWNK